MHRGLLLDLRTLLRLCSPRLIRGPLNPRLFWGPLNPRLIGCPLNARLIWSALNPRLFGRRPLLVELLLTPLIVPRPPLVELLRTPLVELLRTPLVELLRPPLVEILLATPAFRRPYRTQRPRQRERDS